MRQSFYECRHLHIYGIPSTAFLRFVPVVLSRCPSASVSVKKRIIRTNFLWNISRLLHLKDIVLIQLPYIKKSWSLKQIILMKHVQCDKKIRNQKGKNRHKKVRKDKNSTNKRMANFEHRNILLGFPYLRYIGFKYTAPSFVKRLNGWMHAMPELWCTVSNEIYII